MPLVGNDVVDLATEWARDRFQDRRFLDKVFSEAEQDAIRRFRNPNLLLWSLWACKEACYKIVRKLDPGVSFLPRQYRTSLVASGRSRFSSGSVDTPTGRIAVTVEAGDEFIHSLGVLGNSSPWDKVVHQVLPLGTRAVRDEEQPARFESLRIREAVKQRLSDLLGCEPGRIRIVRRKGVRGLGPPTVWVDGKETNTDLSMSHDGRFLAFAYCGAACRMTP